MSNLFRGPSIDASYQVSVHLSQRFQRRRLKKSSNQKQELPVAVMFVNESGQKEQSLQRTFHRCFLPSFSSFDQAISEEHIFQKSTNQKQELPVVAIFVNGSELNQQSLQRSNLYRRPSKDASYQISVHLAKPFQRRRFFRNQSIRNKNCLQQTCLLTDQN